MAWIIGATGFTKNLVVFYRCSTFPAIIGDGSKKMTIKNFHIISFSFFIWHGGTTIWAGNCFNADFFAALFAWK